MLPRIPRWPALFGGELGRAADGRNGPSSSRRTARLRPDEEEAARGGGADRRAQQAGTPEGQETAPDVRPAQGYESRTKLALAPGGGDSYAGRRRPAPVRSGQAGSIPAASTQ